jgi:hypothetical protein
VQRRQRGRPRGPHHGLAALALAPAAHAFPGRPRSDPPAAALIRLWRVLECVREEGFELATER